LKKLLFLIKGVALSILPNRIQHNCTEVSQSTNTIY